MAKLLRQGNEEDFSLFQASDSNEIQRMVDLAHCVSAYRTRGDAAWEWYEEVRPAFTAGRFTELKTQEILEFLFLTCRSDRHGGDGTVYSRRWFVNVANEIRFRTLRSREPNLPQQELLKQPVYIPFRVQKDPRELRILDPACGSGHFLLYCFDLMLTIYEEAWHDEHLPPPRGEGWGREPKSLREDYPTLDDLRCAVPQLILRHNLYGIDIDLRCVQIAALALRMRAGRLAIRRNPGPATESGSPAKSCARSRCRVRKTILQEFLDRQLSATPEQRVLAQLVCRVFQSMKLAGEAGSLLKIEEVIAGLVAKAKKDWLEYHEPKQLPLFNDDRDRWDQLPLRLDVSGITDEQFWEQAEDGIYSACRPTPKRPIAAAATSVACSPTIRRKAFLSLTCAAIVTMQS